MDHHTPTPSVYYAQAIKPLTHTHATLTPPSTSPAHTNLSRSPFTPSPATSSFLHHRPPTHFLFVLFIPPCVDSVTRSRWSTTPMRDGRLHATPAASVRRAARPAITSDQDRVVRTTRDATTTRHATYAIAPRHHYTPVSQGQPNHGRRRSITDAHTFSSALVKRRHVPPVYPAVRPPTQRCYMIHTMLNRLRIHLMESSMIVHTHTTHECPSLRMPCAHWWIACFNRLMKV